MPLVFLHGLALNQRAYREMLCRLAGMGFLVVAVDAAGYGDTQDFHPNKARLADFAALTLRTLDVLGIEKAVLAGHSMGGRIAIELAARAPDRVLAAVLFNAAAGASFDQMLAAMAEPSTAVGAIRAMLRGHGGGGVRLAWTLAESVFGNLRHPMGPVRAALAMLHSDDSTALLHTMRERGVPTLVVHGDNDYIVPFVSACEVAEDAGGSLYRLRGSHSWMIAKPQQGADSLRHLLTGELGDALCRAAKALGIQNSRDSAVWERVLIAPHALVHQLNGGSRTDSGTARSRYFTSGWVRHRLRLPPYDPP